MTKKGGKRGEVQEFFLTSGYKQSAKILSIYRRHMLFVFRLFSPGHEVKPTLRLHMHSGELWRRNSSWVWRVGESLTTFPKWWMTSLIFLQPRDKTLAVVLCQTFWMSGLVQPNLRRTVTDPWQGWFIQVFFLSAMAFFRVTIFSVDCQMNHLPHNFNTENYKGIIWRVDIPEKLLLKLKLHCSFLPTVQPKKDFFIQSNWMSCWIFSN